MKKVILLSLSLMLILTPVVALTLVKVKPTESKKVEPSTYEFKKIQVAQLPYLVQKPTVEAKREVVEVKAEVKAKIKVLSIEDKEKAKINRIADKINNHLGGKLSDKGEVFAETAINNDIDPYLVAAIAIHETGNGESNAIISKNNVGGMMGSNGLKRFSSVDASIEKLSTLLKNHYVDKGLDTIPEISKKYAPIGVDNDPNGLNKSWVSGVRSIYNKLKDNSM